MGRDPQPTRADRRRRREALVVHSSDLPTEVSGVAVEGATPVSKAVARALVALLTRDDGWLRITPHDNGDTVYWKWKWVRGPHINKYVMVVYPQADADEAAAHLARKVDAVDRGEEAAVKDHYFKG